MPTETRRLVRDPEGLNTASWPVPADQLITPTEHFFTRSHAATPRVDPDTWRLEIGGLVERPRRLSLGELLREFPRREVAATLVCAGLRREEYLALGELPGELPWGPEPVSTGRWAGVSLADVLRTVGISPQARHVEIDEDAVVGVLLQGGSGREPVGADGRFVPHPRQFQPHEFLERFFVVGK
jgi:DMSO/TMAO reductase YedYZ molybdopterin-dependent catalytic subunit